MPPLASFSTGSMVPCMLQSRSSWWMSLSVCAGSARSQNILNRYGVGNRWPSFISLLLYPILTQPFRTDWIPKLFRKLRHELVSTKFNLGKSHANSSTWRAKIGPAPSTNSSAVLAAPWGVEILEDGKTRWVIEVVVSKLHALFWLEVTAIYGISNRWFKSWPFHPQMLEVTKNNFLKGSPFQQISQKRSRISQNCQVQITNTLVQPPDLILNQWRG